jgi:hypothetical protein
MITLLTGLIVKHFSAELAGRILLKIAEQYVKNTKTTADDEFLAMIKAAMEAK